MTFEVYAPLFVARQWWKYAVASTHLESQNGWNESSRRYVTETPEFYVPGNDEWRSAPENRKQGSGEVVNEYQGEVLSRALQGYIDQGVYLYEMAMEAGIAAEQARLFLPAYGLYVRWRWTASLGTIIHFLDQRLAHDSQKEMQEYAKAVKELVSQHFPVCMETIGGTV
jgi:thymidylate synthase (FAD)